MTRLPDPERSRAVLVGTSRFDHLPDLPAVRNNLSDLARILTAPTGTGLRHCAVVSDEDDLAVVGAKLEDAAEQAEDVLLVYYSGHGLLDERGELHLTVPSSDPRRLRWTGLPFTRVKEVLADARGRNRVLVLDCCFSGRAIEEFMSDEGTVVSGQLDIDGTYTLTATPRNRPAMAPVGATHTTFSGELITLLDKGVPDGPELLTLGEVYRRLLWTFTSRNLPRPQQRGTRTADLLALVPNRALGPASPASPADPAEQARRHAELAADRARVLGPDHPETLAAREAHAKWVGLAGDPAEAARLHAALLADRTRIGRFPRRVGRSRPDGTGSG
ncbi:caspase family protein [Allokutzneria oryzae]|uniref:Caspase domain-containing protein n=1 Tax=Allokutzneria oryzae TaxID=1378989 RepID=A0ABV6A318_9PSEU